MRDIRPNPKRRPVRPVSRAETVPVTSVSVPKAEKREIAEMAERPAPKLAKKKPKAPKARAVSIGGREKAIVGFVLLMSVLVLGIVAIIFMPEAKITLTLKTAPLLLDETVTLSASRLDADSIPGTSFFREVEVGGEYATKSTEVIGGKASGTVNLVNRTTSPQDIKDKSRLVTEDGVLFYLQKSVKIPAAGNSPAVVPVAVEAAEAGEEGNIEPQKLTFAALDESAASLLYAEAETSISGGSGEAVAVVKQEDLDAARVEAETKARGLVEGQIRKELPEGWIISEESWNYEVLAFDTAVELDAREQRVPYTARVVAKVLGYEKQALDERLRSKLAANLSENYMLFPGDLTYATTISESGEDSEILTLDARVTHMTIPSFSIPTLRSKISAFGEEDAKVYLEGLPGVQGAEIELSPFWVGSVPRIENRIELDFQADK